MKTTTPSARREYALLLGLSFFLLFGGIVATRAYVMDDALITLRYSFNLARHGHAIWNQADLAHPSLGYTTVLWMLINAVPALFTQNKDQLVLFCKLLGLIPLAAIVLLYVDRISRMPVSPPFRVAVVAAIFSQVLYGFHLNSGMETLLFSSLLLLSIGAYAAADNSALAYLFGTLAFLTRPEGSLIVALMLFWDLRRGRRREAAIGGIGFAITALGLGLALHAAYGCVLPDAFYVKQKLVSRSSLAYTLGFLASIALPYLLLAAYSTFRLRDTVSRCCWSAALLYAAYYMTVTPLMNVFSRYQWPVLVLLTYASLPAFQRLAEGAGRRRWAAVGVLLLLTAINLRSAVAARCVATTAGTEERNLIALGKAMARHRDGSRWLAYDSVGAVCYYSDWNTYDTMGLNTRPIAVGAVSPMQVYQYPNTDLVIQNCDEMDARSREACAALRVRLTRLGYQYAGALPVAIVGARQHFVVLLFAKTPGRAAALLRTVQLAPEVPLRQLSWMYALGGGPQSWWRTEAPSFRSAAATGLHPALP